MPVCVCVPVPVCGCVCVPVCVRACVCMPLCVCVCVHHCKSSTYTTFVDVQRVMFCLRQCHPLQNSISAYLACPIN